MWCKCQLFYLITSFLSLSLSLSLSFACLMRNRCACIIIQQSALQSTNRLLLFLFLLPLHFVPIYPATFCLLILPLAGLMRILGKGNRFLGTHLSTFFVIEQPPLAEVTFDAILGKTNVCFILRNIKPSASTASTVTSSGTTSSSSSSGVKRANRLRSSISCPFSSFTNQSTLASNIRERHPISPPPIKSDGGDEQGKEQAFAAPVATGATGASLAMSTTTGRGTTARGKTETVSEKSKWKVGERERRFALPVTCLLCVVYTNVWIADYCHIEKLTGKFVCSPVALVSHNWIDALVPASTSGLSVFFFHLSFSILSVSFYPSFSSSYSACAHPSFALLLAFTWNSVKSLASTHTSLCLHLLSRFR